MQQGAVSNGWEPGKYREPGELVELIWGTNQKPKAKFLGLSSSAAEESAKWLCIILTVSAFEGENPCV